MGDVRADAERWLAEDPDPETRAELRTLLDGGDAQGLADRFGTRLRFGTAGIRGPLGAGPNRMNRAVVRRVTAGLAARLGVEVAAGGRVVVGGDARHGSAAFVDEATAVLIGAGFEVHRFGRPVPTPLVAFAVRHLGAVAGVQITASHNPPGDNGYKVYWSDGAQIAPPLDDEIAAAVDAVGPLSRVALGDPSVARQPGDEVREAYLRAALDHQRHPDERRLGLVYTPLHGVAGGLLTELLRRAGFTGVHTVARQAEPDPDFPTVGFPNPQEPGALDLAVELATERRADLLVANDPDGDRIALAVPAGSSSADGPPWHALSGDEAGCLLADHLLASCGGGPGCVVATTVVSSRLLRRIAAAHRARYAETLTGFKWLARVAADAEADGRRLVCAYEEALGIMVGTAVRDKDGISAALVAADLAAHLRAEGRTVVDALDDLARRHGVHATAGRALRLEGGDDPARAALRRLREQPPDHVDGVGVVRFADHEAGVVVGADGRREPLDTPATPLVGLVLDDRTRLLVRPSGTEPLLKLYAEAIEPVDDDLAASRRRADRRLRSRLDAFVGLALGDPPHGDPPHSRG
ncbi:MAG: phospho-sugar mutase [Actinobacteria bacterium]|nr:phospho-sugar mutase [Actinomycetota bacterium]